MSDVVCEFLNVHKGFRGHEIISDLSLKVHSGEIVAITGPSGSGKTTVLNMLGLLDRPDRGEIKLFGRRAPHPGSRSARLHLRLRLGYLFQNYALIDNATVTENLKIAQTYTPGTRKEKSDSRASAMERVGLDLDPNRKVYELSGGEQQRLAIARLILKPCQMILADEPTGSLDNANRDHVLTLTRTLAEAGKAVIVVTHDDSVSGRSDRHITLGAAKRSPAVSSQQCDRS
ncbi:ABC transporter ATP-binding protein [Arthrobacter bambusae]|jgi:putative ABC transport system ATP-binding protein|uniref:ABC transporter ATP-binding protein n=1 Tax=Arthrobacter TaxID=1663 RepID=UPI001F50759E|nr:MULTISPECIES: ABC transporter ATP-binding protein [Arthrobacter]MCI0143944.1 ABC transporter ATP-binding protein [Arthrobacter bambusae]UYY81258.1 ABC transporter ATP-binding protein [Arthrobacter sp. YA7-1]